MVLPHTTNIDEIKPGNYLSDAMDCMTIAINNCAKEIFNLDVLIWDDDLYGYLLPKYNKVKHLMWVGKNNKNIYKFGKRPNGNYYRTPTFEEFIMINDRLIKIKRLDKLI